MIMGSSENAVAAAKGSKVSSEVTGEVYSFAVLLLAILNRSKSSRLMIFPLCVLGTRSVKTRPPRSLLKEATLSGTNKKQLHTHVYVRQNI